MPVGEFLTPQLPEKVFKKLLYRKKKKRIEKNHKKSEKKRIKGIHIKKISLFFTLKAVGEKIQKESVCQGN